MGRVKRDVVESRQRQAFAISGLALVGVLALLVLAISSQRSAVEARHAARTIYETTVLLSTLKDAESAQRGYLLVGEEAYLRPLVEAKGALPPLIIDLRAQLAAQPADAARLAHLERLASQKLAELDQSIALVRDGRHDQAVALVATGHGEKLMAELRATELQLFVSQRRQALAAQRRAQLIFAGLLAAAGLLLLVTLLQAGVVLSGLRVRARRAEEALRHESAVLEKILDASPDPIFTKDLDGLYTRLNPAAQRLTHGEAAGRRPEDVYPDGFWETITGNDQRILQSGQAEVIEEIVPDPDTGEPLTYLSTKTPLRDAAGAVIGLLGVARDITERKRGEIHQRFLLAELNHRVKNTLATVQAIAAQTFRGLDPGPRADFEGRLMALSAAHNVLTQSGWIAAGLHELVGNAVAPYGDRCRISGPEASLPPRAALALAMTLHELGVNAAKYGALSNAEGVVDVTWVLTEGAALGAVEMIWRESGGPAVKTPTRTGFGARVIAQSLKVDAGGQATVTYTPTGVTCRMTIPLTAPKPSAEFGAQV